MIKLINKLRRKNFLEVINLGNDKTRPLELVEIVKETKNLSEKKQLEIKVMQYLRPQIKKIYSLIKYKPKVI